MKRLVLTIFIVSSLMTGCATLKVDVDIYKGPLSNTAEVQTEQMYAMAIAAQPMLKRLSETLSDTKGLKQKVALKETIDSIRSLYDDRGPKELTGFMDRINTIADRYERAMYRFDHERYAAWWKNTRPDPEKSNRNLIEGYDNYFGDSIKWDWKRLIVDGTTDKAVLGEWATNANGEMDADKIDTNTAFGILRKDDAIMKHADQLFPGNNNKQIRDKFVANVTNKANAYWDARTALHDLLKTALDGLKEKTVPDANKTILEGYTETQIATAKLAANLIRYGFLGNVSCKTPNIGTLNGPWQSRRDVLIGKLIKNPREVADELIKVDEDLVNGVLCENSMDEGMNKKPFGLTMGPDFISDNDQLKPNDLLAAIRGDISAFNSSVNMLQRGRTNDGINTLVEKYLRQRDKATANEPSEELLNLETRLINNLVAFAEKVRFLANNEFFLTEDQYAANSNTPLPNPFGEEAVSQVTNNSDVIKQYIQVLQTIGNSIITLADDFKQQKNFDRKQEVKWQAEQSALRQVYSKNWAGVLNAVIAELQSERNSRLTANTSGIIAELKKISLPTVKAELDAFEKTLGTAVKTRSEIEISTLNERLKYLQNKLAKENQESAGVKEFSEKLTTWKEANRETFLLNIAVIELKKMLPRAVEHGDTAVNAISVIDELISQLDNEKSGAIDDPKQITRALLAKRKFTVSSIGVFEGGRKDPRLMIDQLSAQLRHLRLAETQANGKDTQVGKNIDDTLKLLSSYRSEMAFLRTAGVYLRNSYPTTTLQSNSGVTRDNLLGQQAWRSWMPFFSSFDSDKKTKEEIDRQFWQNINSVRVSGAGDTNYVIAKDDIGNWYVKAYATDPDKIIKSVKGLAMYSFAPALKAVLPANTSKDKATAVAATPVDETLTPVPDPQQTVLEKLLKTHEAKDIERLADIRAELSEEMEYDGKKLLDAIKKAWSDNGALKTVTVNGTDYRKQLDDALQSAANKTLVTAYAELGSEQITSVNLATHRIKVLSAMGALRRFGVMLIQEIRTCERNAPDDISTESSAAQKLAVAIVRSRLDKYITARQTQVDGYKVTLTTLAESLQ